MTPSEKPERSDSSSQDAEANRTSVITQSADESAETTSAEHEGESDGAALSFTADSASGQDNGNPDGKDPSEGDPDGQDPDGAGPPPWQRATDTSGSTMAEPSEPWADSSATTASGVEDTQTIPKPLQDVDTVRTEVPTASGATQAGRTSVPFSGSSSPRSAPGTETGAKRPSRGPRRASLQVKRVDPWSVLKLALVLSVALFFVWLIAVAVLYGVLDGMGIWDQLNGTFTDLTRPDDAASDPLISAGRVFGIASIIGAINIVLWTALATVGAFIYNVAADFAGGVEVTLSERE